MGKELKPKPENIFKETISWDDYRQKIYDCLLKIQNCSEPEAQKLMTEYEADLPQFYEENYQPETVACGMVTHYL